MRCPISLWLWLPAVGCAADSVSWTLRPEAPWSLSWEERRLANEDGVSFPGFSRQALPVQPGWWGEGTTAVRGNTRAEARSLPWLAPVPRAGSASAELDLWAAGGPIFAHVQGQGLVAHDDAPTANPDPRGIWTSQQPHVKTELVDTRLQGSIGLTGLGHVLALSNEPFRWGEGIFGGVVLGGGWQGFPHVVLATRGPQTPAPAGSWLEPLAVGYEIVLGRFDEALPAGDAVKFAGFRIGVRWQAVTLSWTKALLFDGDQQPHLPYDDVACTLLRWRSGNDGTPQSGKPNPNRFASLGFRLDWPETVAWSIEYGIDDQNSHVPGQWLNTTLTQEARWTSAIWTVTVDWLDVADDGDWRVALEWYRAESYAYSHSLYPWRCGESPLAHPDGGNSQSLRLLMQAHGDDDDRWTIVASWRRHGMRNAESGNPNTARRDVGIPGSGTYAWRPWDRLSLDGRYEQDVSNHWRWWLEAAAAWHSNQDFVDNKQRAEGLLGLGISYRW
ncbi:MAG: hypothetical protein N3A02_01440 [Rectinema sp.]|nr:hypothetical protein [Rectinema sp.]